MIQLQKLAIDKTRITQILSKDNLDTPIKTVPYGIRA
ncbi:uncharacterized protein METZ01_LOCUS124132 [marine metagenome]|uniref:Uncharacterized protein n=1 Tax=marine metagenome TaxID=408172 RepID=A0A381Y2P3_9ZZZZ